MLTGITVTDSDICLFKNGECSRPLPNIATHYSKWEIGTGSVQCPYVWKVWADGEVKSSVFPPQWPPAEFSQTRNREFNRFCKGFLLKISTKENIMITGAFASSSRFASAFGFAPKALVVPKSTIQLTKPVFYTFNKNNFVRKNFLKESGDWSKTSIWVEI